MTITLLNEEAKLNKCQYASSTQIQTENITKQHYKVMHVYGKVYMLHCMHSSTVNTHANRGCVTDRRRRRCSMCVHITASKQRGSVSHL